jgi:alpha-L-fucosidase
MWQSSGCFFNDHNFLKRQTHLYRKSMKKKGAYMTKKNIFISCLLALIAGLILTCKFETAYGPTPYTLPPIDTTGQGQAQLKSKMKNYLDSLLLTKSAPDSLAKATTVRPSLLQAYVDMKFGMFIHFSMSTFDRCCCSGCKSVGGEWGRAASSSVVPSLFQPSKLDVGQWVRVAKSAGMKYMVLTTKHHDGFCVWPTRWNKHNVKYSSWRNGQGDVLKEFVDTLHANGIKVGFYYSIWDHTSGNDTTFIKAQLAELLTNYGPIAELYLDGWGWMVGYTRVPYATVRNWVKTLQPECLISENDYDLNQSRTDILTWERAVVGFPPITNVIPSEAGNTIRTDGCWFWHPLDECNILPAETIVNDLTMLNSRNASYLLDLTPDTTGLMPQCVIDRMAEVGVLRGVAQ